MAIESKMAPRVPIGARPMDEQKSPAWWWISTLILLIVIALGWYYWSSSPEDASIVQGEYQAVFLDNGQTYFGKLESKRNEFIILTDVFYLQAGVNTTDPNSSLSLMKLGQEAHGPEDRMEINTQHILFIEDMKTQSKVVQAIQAYQSKK